MPWDGVRPEAASPRWHSITHWSTVLGKPTGHILETLISSWCPSGPRRKICTTKIFGKLANRDSSNASSWSRNPTGGVCTGVHERRRVQDRSEERRVGKE